MCIDHLLLALVTALGPVLVLGLILGPDPVQVPALVQILITTLVLGLTPVALAIRASRTIRAKPTSQDTDTMATTARATRATSPAGDMATRTTTIVDRRATPRDPKAA